MSLHGKRQFTKPWCENCNAPCSDKYSTELKPCLSQKAVNDKDKTVEKSSQKNEYYLPNINQEYNTIKQSKCVIKNSASCEDKDKCIDCKNNIRKVNSLLYEISHIRNSGTVEMCKYCMRSNIRCKRCEYMVTSNYKKQQNCLKIWICKVHKFLQDILNDKKLCLYSSKESIKLQRSCSKIDLERLFQQLKMHLSMHEQEQTGFSLKERCPSSYLERISETKNVLDEVVKKFSYGNNYQSQSRLDIKSSLPTIGCICKYIGQKKTEKDDVIKEKIDNEHSALIKHSIKEKSQPLTHKSIKETKDPTQLTKITKSPKKHISKSKEVPTIKDSTKKNVKRKSKVSKDDVLLLKLISEKKTQKKKDKTEKTEKKLPIKKIASLPQLIRAKSIEITDVTSDSILECDKGRMNIPNVMIKGRQIVYNAKDKDLLESKKDNLKPMFFHRYANVSDGDVQCQTPNPTVISKDVIKNMNDANKYNPLRGLVQYRLSEKRFIESGWTKLPSLKTVRKMNMFKMIPTSNYNWFERQTEELTFYESGEKFSEMYEDGSGRWFYRNGHLALTYCKESISSQWYVVYSTGEANQNRKTNRPIVLASFDFFGSGVVYDHSGNERFKYNQSEGLIIDDKIGPAVKWKWHSLNDPPVYQTILVENYEKENLLCLSNLFPRELSNESSVTRKRADEEMIMLEHQNLIKDNYRKLKQQFKPFEIKMKALKINNYFSLRVIDQMHIYLIFRDRKTSIKLNVGMMLKSDEIVSTDTCIIDFRNSYEFLPPKSKYVTDNQQMVKKTEN